MTPKRKVSDPIALAPDPKKARQSTYVKISDEEDRSITVFGYGMQVEFEMETPVERQAEVAEESALQATQNPVSPEDAIVNDLVDEIAEENDPNAALESRLRRVNTVVKMLLGAIETSLLELEETLGETASSNRFTELWNSL